ncbi:Maf1 regulator [Toxoplasma gondii MAS]|uniref:Maf1 regulator n=1 Tax=Toxoplasma gondii MAS TaxID=943118 RepID=A0A086QTV1_TOXGO|nr:Maf1 regulator [Toxoplasma gondii MAS]
MRFLDAPALTRLSALLQHLDVGDRVIRGRLELLSTCSQSCIERRQLAEEIEKEISSSPLFLASSSPQPILLSSPHGARAATLRGPRDGRGEKDACKEGGSSPNSRKKRKTSCSPSSAFSSPAFSCTAFELPPRQLDLPRKLDDAGEEERAVESEPPRSRSARGRGRRADSGQTEEKATALLGKKEGGSKGQHSRGNAEKNDSETLSDDEEHDGKDVLVNLIGALNQCFPDYEFWSGKEKTVLSQHTERR